MRYNSFQRNRSNFEAATEKYTNISFSLSFAFAGQVRCRKGRYNSFTHFFWGANSLNKQRTVIGPDSTGVYAHKFVRYSK